MGSFADYFVDFTLERSGFMESSQEYAQVVVCGFAGAQYNGYIGNSLYLLFFPPEAENILKRREKRIVEGKKSLLGRFFGRMEKVNYSINMEERKNCKDLLREYKEFRDNMQPKTVGWGPFRHQTISSREQRKLIVLKDKVEGSLECLSKEELASLLLGEGDSDLKKQIQYILLARERHSEVKKGWLFRLGLVPTYTEVALFLMSLTFLFLFIFNDLFRKEFFEFFFEDFDGREIAVLIFFVAGLALSVYHAFSKKRVTKRVKNAMLFFAVFINFLVGFYAGFYTLEKAKGYLIIFPVINIISAFLLLLLLRFEVITSKSISDKQAKLREIILGSIIICAIFVISQYLFHNYWAITFSLCVVYATNVNNFINKWFF